jgi:uncharacterized protein YlxW (UPF0749 family)
VSASDSSASDSSVSSKTAEHARRRRLTSHLLIAALCALLGFAIVVQVRRTDSGDALADARPQDLVEILDGLNRRADELTVEIADLERTLATLKTGGASSAAALEEARRQAATLAVLAGTAPATGPGVTIVIDDPNGTVPPEVLLAAMQELRNAGSEAMQVNAVRIGVDSYFSGVGGAVVTDGVALTAPYSLVAIGDPPTLTAAMQIPGGVSDTVRRAGGTLTIQSADSVTVDALRPVRANTYARPAGG